MSTYQDDLASIPGLIMPYSNAALVVTERKCSPVGVEGSQAMKEARKRQIPNPAADQNEPAATEGHRKRGGQALR